MVSEGQRIEVPVLIGYKLDQYRPFECRHWCLDPRFDDGRYSGGCKCDKCNGTTTVYLGTVERIIYWADNSIEAIVKCDDGETRRTMLRVPYGDVC